MKRHTQLSAGEIKEAIGWPDRNPHHNRGLWNFLRRQGIRVIRPAQYQATVTYGDLEDAGLLADDKQNR